MSLIFVDPGTLPFVNFSAPGSSSASYLASPLYSQSTLWGVPPQTSIWNGTLSVMGNCPSGSQLQSGSMAAYFLLQPATYNDTTKITYPPFFALAAYNSSLLDAFDQATYSGNSTAIKVIDPTNEVYITSAIQWQHSDQNWVTGSGYYVEEWDFGVAANGSLTGSCTIDEFDDTLNACGTLKFPTGVNDPFNCTGSLPTNFATLYDIENSTVDATLSDNSGVVSIRGITPNGVHVVMNFSGTFWPNSTAFSQLGIQDEHAVAPATSTNVWLYKPTSTAGASKGTKQTTKPNAATRVEAMQFGVYGRVFLLLFFGVLGAELLQ